MWWLNCTILLAAALAGSICELTAAETYLVTDLGALGGASSSALAVNTFGSVAGFANTLTGQFHAVVLSNTVLSDLGTLGGSNSVATDLNQANQAVGWANGAGSQAQRAALFSNGTITDLAALLTDSTNSVAHAVNSAGTIVGEYQTSAGQRRPFVYANGMIPLGFEGAANCVNDAGQIGGYETSGGKLGFIISGGERSYVGTLGSNDTEVVRINTNGVAVGRSLTPDGVYHAFGYQGGTLRDLGTLGGSSSQAYGINNGGHIVGTADDAQGVGRAFIYRKGSMADLNSFLPPGSGWFLSAAYAINDAGQIAGSGQFKGQSHGFLMTPNFLDIAFYPGLTVTGKPGRNYRVDYLDALSPTNSWQTLTNFVLPVSPYFFIDPQPVVFANRLYRSVLLP